MNQPFEKLNEIAKKLQAPFQEIAELNVRTLQAVNYLKPEELTTIRKPEELWEKQINLAVENGHNALNYMQKTYEIIEKAMLSLMQETRKNNPLH
ncbi:phasin family protein [Legionella micdadei]|uniref:Phasin protein n=1 Tax=Legionella micdadei TaxID=451 RepID=A0A098GDV6_LEGMI|nr:phasin family protein [Legionella micdadei]ARG96461.1 hypothetical protein B6N58_01490 [Legionella micdadei]ARG99211.1 hypothetical protein B6V88_01480 [Legionella micdadei]KTD29447.1 Phasin protein [Legionella micdadei]NSL18155.1 phasin family protein [Legionella micdadei]CEG59671.1 conserved protein of unknown function [Legionella micdadei]